MLIIETSTQAAYIALRKKEGALLEYKPLDGGTKFNLPAEIATLLKCHPGPIVAVAVGTGPGSFTGTRVGLACAKALAFAWKVPLHTFCSLASYSRPPSSAVVINAHSEGVHLFIEGAPETLPLDAAERRLADLECLLSPHPEELQKRLPRLASRFTKAIPHVYTANR